MNKKELKTTGLIPAAGHASRVSPIPCSKEVFPVGFQKKSGEKSVKVAASHLLEGFCKAGVDQVYMITRKGKWDIPQYLGTGLQPEYSLAYIFTDPTSGTHHTLDLAYRFVKDKIVLLGFPDILFKPKNAFIKLLEKQRRTKAEVVLGLFKANNPNGADMVEVNSRGHLKKIVIKPDQTNLQYTWIIAAWTPAFSNYLHEFVAKKAKENSLKLGKEVFIGDVIQHALENGLTIETVFFPDGKYTDIGTLTDLKRIWNDGF